MKIPQRLKTLSGIVLDSFEIVERWVTHPDLSKERTNFMASKVTRYGRSSFLGVAT